MDIQGQGDGGLRYSETLTKAEKSDNQQSYPALHGDTAIARLFRKSLQHEFSLLREIVVST